MTQEVNHISVPEDSRILVIGDTHFTPGCSMRRAEWLGVHIDKRRPDVIIAIGDWYDMHSLNQYEKHGSKSMEGVSVQADIDAGDNAWHVAFRRVNEWNERMRANKKAQYNPLKIFIHGNHEYRLDRFLQDNPKWDGIVGYNGDSDADISVPYRHYLGINGVYFTHVPHNALKPIESVYGIRRVLALSGSSIVHGHNHRLDFATATRIGTGQQLYGMSVGCLFDEDPPYMDGRIKDYWRGVVELSNVKDGKFDFQTFTYRPDV